MHENYENKQINIKDNNLSEEELIKKLQVQTRNIQGSAEDKKSHRNKLEAAIRILGVPSFFATCSYNDRSCAQLRQLAHQLDDKIQVEHNNKKSLQNTNT